MSTAHKCATVAAAKITKKGSVVGLPYSFVLIHQGPSLTGFIIFKNGPETQSTVHNTCTDENE